MYMYFSYNMSPILRKPTFLHMPIFKPLSIFYGCTAWFLSDLVENPEDRFSHDVAHMKIMSRLLGIEQAMSKGKSRDKITGELVTRVN